MPLALSQADHTPILTLITTSTCPHCLRLKHHISSLPSSTPFKQIQIDANRVEKARLLSTLTFNNASSVPQVFLGNLSLGGADETIALVNRVIGGVEADDSGGRSLEERMYAELSEFGEGEEGRAKEAKMREIFPAELFANTNDNDNGNDKVVGEWDHSRFDEEFVAKHVQANANSAKATSSSLLPSFFSLNFKSSMATTQKQLNTAHKPNSNTLLTPESANSLVSNLKTFLSTIELRHTDPPTSKIDYLAIASDPSYTEVFAPLTSLLQNLPLFNLPRNEKIPLLTNLYNLMCAHAFVAHGIPFEALQRLQYFDYSQYVLNVPNGGVSLSLNGIENGVLRGNRIAPYHLTKSVKKGWATGKGALPLADDEVDERIHFALNCGAASCPIVKSYSIENWDEEFGLGAEGFLRENVFTSTEERTVRVSMILKWYAKDFGPEVLDKIYDWMADSEEKDKLGRLLDKGVEFSNEAERLASGKRVSEIKIKYLPYDWGIKASKCVKFRKGYGKRVGL